MLQAASYQSGTGSGGLLLVCLAPLALILGILALPFIVPCCHDFHVLL